MSTTPTEPTNPETPAGQANPAPAPTPPATPPAPAQEPDWKAKYEETIAESRKWESRSKENAEAAKRLAEIEESAKTEAEKQAEALAKAQAKVKEYETKEQIATWKAEVAEATGVPAVALAGSTKEEIEAHAETLKPLIAQQQPIEPPKLGVVPTIGNTPANTPNIPIGEQIAAAETLRQQADIGSDEWKKANALVMDLKGMQLYSAATATK